MPRNVAVGDFNRASKEPAVQLVGPEALRRAMPGLIDGGAPRKAHPVTWAPFVVVGEGAARLRDRIDRGQQMLVARV